MVLVCQNRRKNGRKTAVFSAAGGMVFGMAVVLCRFGKMAAKSRRKPRQRKLTMPSGDIGTAQWSVGAPANIRAISLSF